jgi:diguanylate cyclase (GGDEF)-like protein
MKNYGPAMRMFGVFNLCLCISLALVALRGGTTPDFLTRTGANLTGLTAFVALWAGGRHLFSPEISMKEPWLVWTAATVIIIILSQMPDYGNQRIATEFVAITWIILRASANATPIVLARFGKFPAMATAFIAWGFSAVLMMRAIGGLFLGWHIEIDSNQGGTLAFAYLVLATVTSINSLLAYMLLRSVLSEVESLARHDPLTGLLNRRAFSQQQALCWDRWQRKQSAFAAICLDIDHFKTINDQFGHDMGDRTLVLVAQALQKQVRPTDTLARTGGEEFILLMDLHESGDSVMQIAERLRMAVQTLSPWPDAPQRRVTVSLGAALSTPQDERPENVITRADRALYCAKANGRNRIETSPELAFIPRLDLMPIPQ